MLIIYNFLIGLYPILVKTFSFLGHNKAFEWTEGRRYSFSKLNSFCQKHPNPIWIHCASLGEFEQVRPLIELIKKKHPHEKILLSFFSPSGFEIRKNYSHVDEVIYLPNDSLVNTIRFIKILQPKLTIFVKYEFWINYINELRKGNHPVILVSAIFTKKDIFFKWYGKIFRNLLNQYTSIFVQGQNSYDLIKPYNQDIKIATDTRIDRVADITENVKNLPIIESFTKDYKVIIGGSTYAKENKFLAQYMKHAYDDIKLIIAPPEINKVRIQKTLKLFDKHNPILYSDSVGYDLSKNKVLIIDNIGLLSSIYAHGDIAIIGGGYNNGIHNTLEPMAFGVPIMFGPKFTKFKEAKDTLTLGGSFTFKDYKQFKARLDLLVENDKSREKASTIVSNYIKENQGGTEFIYNSIQKYFV